MKKKIIAFIFILLFAFIVIEPKKLNAESFLSDKSETRYDVTSGLLTGKANTICQTDDGYIWIGQYAGLTKFDNKSSIIGIVNSVLSSAPSCASNCLRNSVASSRCRLRTPCSDV